MTRYYCVADAETTGLDAHKNHLLEIAAHIVDAKTLDIVSPEPFHAVVYYPVRAMVNMRSAANEVVQAMHDKTELWRRITMPGALPLNLIDQMMTEWLALFGPEKSMPVMGNSVRLDMNFIDVHLPRVSAQLDYHMRDVSTLAGFASDWLDVPWFEKKMTHEALSDVEECIEELKYYRSRAMAVSLSPSELIHVGEFMAQLGREMQTAEVSGNPKG